MGVLVSLSQALVRWETTPRETQLCMAQSHWICSETTEHRSFLHVEECFLLRSLAFAPGHGYAQEEYAMKRETMMDTSLGVGALMHYSDKLSRRTCRKTIPKAWSGSSKGSISKTWTDTNNSALEIVWWWKLTAPGGVNELAIIWQIQWCQVVERLVDQDNVLPVHEMLNQYYICEHTLDFSCFVMVISIVTVTFLRTSWLWP